MDWIYKCQTYEMKIRYSTTAEGVIEWEENQVLYQDVCFKIEQLQGIMHKMVEEAHRDLIELLMLEMNTKGKVKEGQLPLIN
jgi:hypothetical protein